MRSPSLIVFLLVVLVAIGGGVYFAQPRTGGEALQASTSRPAIGTPFLLTDQNGEPVDSRRFRSRFMLVYFGFTHCPNVCPVDMSSLSTALSQLEEEERIQVAPLFITLDPGRDTPAQLKSFLAAFHPAFTGLTGTAEQIHAVRDGYKVFAAEREDAEENAGYTMDHSAYTYLMDRHGRYVTHFPSGTTAEEIVTALRGVLGN